MLAETAWGAGRKAQQDVKMATEAISTDSDGSNLDDSPLNEAGAQARTVKGGTQESFCKDDPWLSKPHSFGARGVSW
jgi:hypothetical protein